MSKRSTRQRALKKAQGEKRIRDRRKAKLQKEPPNITENGRRIRRFMIEHNVRGNYRDYVIVVGQTLIDYYGTLPFPSEFEGAALIHKKDLKNIVDPDVAAKFWHPKFGRVGAFVKPATKKSLH